MLHQNNMRSILWLVFSDFLGSLVICCRSWRVPGRTLCLLCEATDLCVPLCLCYVLSIVFWGKYHQSSLYWLASLNLWAPRKSHCWLILLSYESTFGQVTMVALYLLWMERHYFNTVAPENIFVYICEWWCCIQSKTLIML